MRRLILLFCFCLSGLSLASHKPDWHLLQQALQQLEPGQPGRRDVFIVSVAGYMEPAVFHNEMALASTRLQDKLGAKHTQMLQLSNSTLDAGQLAGARLATLRATLRHIGGLLQRDEDVLALYLVSHGDRYGRVALQPRSANIEHLSAKRLGTLLDEAGIRWRMIWVSACYSGRFVSQLGNDESLVMSAARANRPSFGCGAQDQYTWFGNAVLEQSDRQQDWEPWLREAMAHIRRSELAQRQRHSDPQLHIGPALLAHLRGAQ